METLIAFILFLMLIFVGKAFDPCDIQQTISSENERLKNNRILSHENPICDHNVINPTGEWFRFTRDMVRDRIEMNECGTRNGIWLYGPLPEVAEGIVNRRVCVRSVDYYCSKTYVISIKNCATHSVYFLPRPTACPEAYCFEKNPCETSREIPYQIARMANSILVHSEPVICDRSIIKSDGEWFITTEEMVNSSLHLSCGTEFGIWMQGKLPSLGDGEVFRTACVTGKQSDCKKNYTMKVKNCGTSKAFFLPPPTDCPEAYCFGYGLSDRAPISSPDKPSVEYEVIKQHTPRLSYEKLSLNCRFKLFDDASIYYEIYWFADNKILTIAEPVRKENLILASLNEENGLRLNIKVQCMVRLRNSRIGSPGRFSTKSDSKFIGIMIHGPPPKIRIGGEVEIHLSLTIPFQCPFFGQEDTAPASCALHLHLDTPKSTICSTSTINLGNLGNCGIEILRRDWNKSHSILVRHSEHRYPETKIFFIQLTTLASPISKMWDNIALPLISVPLDDEYLKSLLCHVEPQLHILTFSGVRFEIVTPGSFMLYHRVDMFGNIFQVQIETSNCQLRYCICALAVRAASDVFVLNRCHGALDFVEKCSSKLINVMKISDTHFQIYMAFGTYLDIDLQNLHSYKVIEIKIYPSFLDKDDSTGLCGSPIRRELKDRNGNIDRNFLSVSLSWRIHLDENLIHMNESEINTLSLLQGNISLCVCKDSSYQSDFQTSNIVCSDEKSVQCNISLQKREKDDTCILP